MADETYRGLLENISETSGTYKQMLAAIAEGGGGGGGGVLVATVDMQTRALDKTWKQLDEAVFAVVKINEATNKLTLPVLITARESETSFMVASMSAANPATTMVFAATSEDGYPVIQT